jgi:hypothetical protein
VTVTPFDSLTFTFEVSWTTAWNAAASYVDESAYVRSMSIRRGRSSAFDQFSAGTLTVELDNTTRRFDPIIGASALSPNVVPRKLCRVSVTYSAVTYRLFTGYLTALPQAGEMSNTLGTATLTAADGFNMLARAKLPTGGAFVGDGETLSARIGRLLDYAAWPAGLRDIDLNSPTSVHTQENGQPVLANIYEVTNGDLGQFFMAGDGDATYHGHAWQLANNLTAAATVGDGAGEIGYSDVVFTYDDTLLYNRALCTYYTGSESSTFVLHTGDFEDATSITAYGESAKDLGLIGVNNANVVQNTLEWVVAYYKDPKLRVSQLSFNPRRSPATHYPVVLGAEIGTRWTFKRRPQNVGSAISQDVIVEGVTHTMTPSTFESTFDLSAAPLTSAGDSYWRMGFGKWTTGTPSATWA